MTEAHPDRTTAPEAPPSSRTYGPVPPRVSDQARIDQLTAERDRYASMLLAAEQELAKRSLGEPDDLEWYQDAFLTLVDSRSWRLTKPLRAFGGVARRVRSRIKV